MIRKFISFLKGVYNGNIAYMNSELNWRLYNSISFIKNLFTIQKNSSIENLDELHDIEVERLRLCVNRSKFSLENLMKNKMYWPNHVIEFSEIGFDKNDKLYQKIMNNGYKTQKELGEDSANDEIMAVINSNGKYIVVNGFKRCLIAKALDIKILPVRVVKRHKNWLKFKAEVRKDEHQNGVYQQVLHPDFRDVKFHRKSKSRWDLIKSALPINSGSLLDIGSNWGYFSHKFEDIGFNCTAVERNYKCNYFLKKLKEIENKNFDIYNGSVFKIPKINYDVVLALSIFHGFIRNKNAYDKMTELLSKLKMDYMFFEPHKGDEVDDGFYVNYTPEEFASYIVDKSCLNHYKYLGESTRQRKLFLISKERIE